MNPLFEQWVMAAKDQRPRVPMEDMLLMSVLLYGVCGNDKDRFNVGLNLLEQAFEAGMKAGEQASS